MNDLKDVLFLMPKKPDPPYEDGTVLIYYYLTKYLNDMNIIYFENNLNEYRPDPLYPSYEENHNVTILKLKNNTKKKASFLNGYDIDMNFYYDETCLEEIIHYINVKNIKVIFCNITLFRYAEKLKKLTDCKVILHSIDAKSMVEKSKLRKGNIKEIIKSVLKYRLYKGLENKFNMFDQIIVVSDLDRHYLLNSQSLHDKKVVTVANGVDIDFFQPQESKRNQMSLKLGFSGIMNYFPNYEAAMYFMNNIFPRVLKAEEDLDLFIIGKNPPRDLQEVAIQFKGKVKVTGFVEDIREYLAMLDIYISPLNSGGGIKNKILEAMSMGLPIIASETSVAGIDYDSEILVYKNDDDLFLKIMDLLKDAEKRNKLAKAAREFVERNYSWEKKTLEYHSIIKNLMLERKGE